MTLRSITQIPGTFKAAVDIFGVSNLISFTETIPEDWKPFMAALVGDPQAGHQDHQHPPADGDHAVDCKVDNLSVMLKAEFLRKA